jgi:hypothetical protein
MIFGTVDAKALADVGVVSWHAIGQEPGGTFEASENSRLATPADRLWLTNAKTQSHAKSSAPGAIGDVSASRAGDQSTVYASPLGSRQAAHMEGC